VKTDAFSALRGIVQETGRDGKGYLGGCSIVPLYSGLWIHSQNLLSSHCRTASEHHLTSAWVVLSVDSSAQGKIRLSPPFHPLRISGRTLEPATCLFV